MPLFQAKVYLHFIGLAAEERESVLLEQGHCQGVNKIGCEEKVLLTS